MRRVAACVAVGGIALAGCGSSSGPATTTAAPHTAAATTSERYTLDLEATIDDRLAAKYVDKSLLSALCGATTRDVVTCISRGRIYRVTRQGGAFTRIARDTAAEDVCNRVAYAGCTVNTVPLPGRDHERVPTSPGETASQKRLDKKIAAIEKQASKIKPNGKAP